MASKAVSPLDYVARAVSKDESRYNMQSAYRDGKRLVATDGHRLHLVDGLDGDTKGFLDGDNTYQFPNYETVIPKGPLTVARLAIDDKQIRQLGHLLKTIKEKNAVVTMESNPNEGTITLSREFRPECESLEGGFRVVFRNAGELRPFKVGINLRYFIEALLGGIYSEFTIQTEKPDTKETTSALVLKYNLGSLSYSAIIMPVRLD
jgi:DNA polymerase III sliding clamp (beta) subunit (PCNA family)